MAFVWLTAFLLAAPLPSPAHAQCDDVCKPNEVVVDEGPTWCRCRDRQKYAVCIGRAGEKLRTQVKRKCGRVFADCFHEADIEVTLQQAECLALSLVGCGAASGACISVCGAFFVVRDVYIRTLQCEARATPCFEEQLAADRNEKNLCKQEED